MTAFGLCFWGVILLWVVASTAVTGAAVYYLVFKAADWGTKRLR